MAAAATDLVRKKKSNFSTTLSSGINDSVATIPLSSSSGLPTDTAITLTIDRVDANAVSTPTLMERVTGVVGVNQLTTSTRGVEGTAQSHSAGAVVEDIWEAATWNDLCTAFLVNHSQTGHIKSGAQIDDTSADHQYVFAVSELAADRTVTLPLLLSADTFAFTDMIQTFSNKTLITPTINSGHIMQMVQSADAPSSPASNYVKLYFKSDKKLYKKDSAGTETEIGGAQSGDGWTSYSAVTPTILSATFDDPTYPIVFAGVDLSTTLYAGMKVKITQGTVKYGIITKVAFSTNTIVTLYMGTDYDMVDTGATAVSAFSYSTAKCPAGFPPDPVKWTHEVTDTTNRNQNSAVTGTWYNLGSVNISIPIGSWKVTYQASTAAQNTGSATYLDLKTTLSTANNSESTANHTSVAGINGASGSLSAKATFFREIYLVLAAKTAYYLNTKVDATDATTVNINQYNSNYAPLYVRAVCAYL